MTTEQLSEQGAIWFAKINEGLNRYKDITMKLDEKKAYTHFKNLMQEYGQDHAFVDFYYYRLDEDSKEMVDEALTSQEQSYLAVLQPLEDVEDEIIFPLDEQLLKIIVKLNAQEILFSTIYFTESEGGRKRTTWWGNYDNEYICFTDRKEE
jgi:hypothetical protein